MTSTRPDCHGESAPHAVNLLPVGPAAVFISYAKNLEDVVLWRALGEIERGTYVDVGSTDPVRESATFALYRQGWRGALVTAEPSFVEALRERRPGDVVIAAAAADPAGPVAPLDDLLVEAGFDGRTIHVCTIDVAGRESDALAGFDLRRWHPWVLVVAATMSDRPEPAHRGWEPRVLESGYLQCLFDGVNRFYVDERQADRLGHVLSFPACALDQPFERHGDAERREALDRAAAQVEFLETTNSDLQRQLATIEDTLSWKVTRPLRAARSLQLRRSPPSDGTAHHAPLPVSEPNELRAAFGARLLAAASVLHSGAATDEGDLDEAVGVFRDALVRSPVSDRAKAWLALVTVDASFPGGEDVETIARRLRMDGAGAVTDELTVYFRRALTRGTASTVRLDVVREAVLVDVSNTVSTGIATGIQRVVREVTRRWRTADPTPTLVHFDARHNFLRPLRPSEETTLLEGTESPAVTRGDTLGADGLAAVIPWRCRFVIPELLTEHRRCEAYRGISTAGVLETLSMIAYDVVPLIASETTDAGIAALFIDYLSVLKHADRISAISRSTADAYLAFAAMTTTQGIRPPVVVAHPLPTEEPRLSEETVEAARVSLDVGSLPLVLVVGSQEPRKNHLRVLEASERLWSAGSRFELVFIGGSGWKGESFEDLVGRLGGSGRPVRTVRRASDEELWAVYRLARFTVFPSLVEGFGLPVAESLASGTPAITSRHGSMSEIAEGGGCLLVDPYDVTAIATAMEQLLHDEVLLERLRTEARNRKTSTWPEYADAVWSFLVEGR